MSWTRMVVLSLVAAVIVGVPVGYAVAQSDGGGGDDPYSDLPQAPASDAPSSVEQVPCSEMLEGASSTGDEPQVCLRAHDMAPALDGGIPVATMEKICDAESAETASRGACADLPEDLARAKNP